LLYERRAVPGQTVTVKNIVDQKVVEIRGRKRMNIHKSITRVDPTTTIQVMMVQLRKHHQKRVRGRI
jgi:hypothetical protein